MPFAQERRSWSCHFPACALLRTTRRFYLKSCITTAISPPQTPFSLLARPSNPSSSFCHGCIARPLLFRAKRGEISKGDFFPSSTQRGGRLIGSLKGGQNRGFVTPLMPQRWTPLLSLSRIKTLRSNLSSFFNAKRKETRVFLPLRAGKCYTRRAKDVRTSCFLFPFFFFLPMIIAQFRRQIPDEDAAEV